jgi:hypothetical protein
MNEWNEAAQGQLIAHRGGWIATEADIRAVPVPIEDGSYIPVPHPRLVEEVRLHLPRFGLQVMDESYALARDGAQLFGVLSCQAASGDGEYCVAIGLRNSYDKSFSVNLCAGSRVFCCDNLAFSGEAEVSRKHTLHVFRDLPEMIYRMLSSVAGLNSRHADEIRRMKTLALDVAAADHLLVESVRRDILPASSLPRVIEAYDRPKYPEFAPRVVWSLYNAFTEVTKSRSPRAQMDSTLALSALFREVILS